MANIAIHCFVAMFVMVDNITIHDLAFMSQRFQQQKSQYF